MSKIKVSALGGIGEHGKYLFVVEIDDSIFVLDAGLKNPEIDFFGIDAVIPDISYLIDNKEKIVGIFITHGHEENIGALPFLLRNIKLKVFGTHFTISLIENMLSKNEMSIKDYKLFRINENKVLNFKNILVTFFPVTHTIPEAVGIAIHVPDDGVIVYTSDFNFGAAVNELYRSSFPKLCELNKSQKVLMVLSESLGIAEVDRVTNDTIYEHTLQSTLTLSTNRIFATLYSTDLSRIQTVIDIGIKNNRKIAFVYPTHDRVMEVAISTGYLRIPEQSKVELTKENVNDPNLLIIVAGTKRERYSLLQEMLSQEEQLITLKEDDHVIIISKPLIGTEIYATQVLDLLYRNDVNITLIDNKYLRSSHASLEDLNILYTVLKPKYIVPIIGEYRHQFRHFEVLKQMGYPDDRIIHLDNGVMAVFENQEFIEYLEIPAGDVLVDGTLIGNVNDQIMDERETLGENGLLIVLGYISRKEKKLIKDLYVFTKGYVETKNTEEAKTKLIELSNRIIGNALNRSDFKIDDLTQALETEIGKILYRIDHTRPTVVPMIVEVE